MLLTYMKLLMEKGAKMGGTQRNVLNVAAERCSIRVLEFLLQHEGAEVNPPNFMSPLAVVSQQFGYWTRWYPPPDSEVRVRAKENAEFLISRCADMNHLIDGIPWWSSHLDMYKLDALRFVLEHGNFPPSPKSPPSHPIG